VLTRKGPEGLGYAAFLYGPRRARGFGGIALFSLVRCFLDLGEAGFEVFLMLTDLMPQGHFSVGFCSQKMLPSLPPRVRQFAFSEFFEMLSLQRSQRWRAAWRLTG